MERSPFNNPNFSLDSDSDLDTPSEAVDFAESLYNQHKEFQDNLRDASEKALEYSEFIRQTTSEHLTDTLTNCLNRTFLEFYKENVFDPHSDSDQIAAIFCDVNNLKETNDSLGHDAGDKLIRDFSEHLQKTFAPEGNEEILTTVAEYALSSKDSPDTAALKEVITRHNAVIRLGGDEFLIIYHNTDKSQDLSEELATKLPQISSESSVSYAYGSAVYNESQQNFSKTMEYADQAMYENKQSSGLSRTRTRARSQSPNLSPDTE